MEGRLTRERTCGAVSPFNAFATVIVSVVCGVAGVVDGREVETLDRMDDAWGTFLRVLGREICNTTAVCRPILRVLT